jgi:hypothetical protein
MTIYAVRRFDGEGWWEEKRVHADSMEGAFALVAKLDSGWDKPNIISCEERTDLADTPKSMIPDKHLSDIS